MPARPLWDLTIHGGIQTKAVSANSLNAVALRVHEILSGSFTLVQAASAIRPYKRPEVGQG